MAQTGYTPIQLYYSTTAAAVPTAGNLANGELAINITDGKLYYKNNGGTVTLLAGSGGAITPITNNGVVYINGSGQATSGSALTYNGTTFSSSNTGGSYLFKFSDTTNNNSLGLYSDATNMRLMSLDNTFTTFKSMNFYGTPFVFYENGTEAMRLTSTGLGIGTSSPSASAKLTLAGTNTAASLLIYNNSQSANTALIGTVSALLGTGTNNDLAIGVFGSQNITFYTGGTSEKMRLDSSGNLGIGTSSPGSYGKLAVIGGDVLISDGYSLRSGVSYGAVLIGRGTGAGAAINVGSGQAGDYLTFSAGGTERMRLDTSGNLGLGVTPSAWGFGNAIQAGSTSNLWDATGGTVYLTNNAYFDGGNWRRQTANYASYYRQINGGHDWSIAGTSTAGSTISFTQAMTLDASGNLGVGTSSPTNKLDVQSSSTSVYANLQSTANTTRAWYQTSAKTGAGVTVTGYVGSVGDASDFEIGSTSNHPVLILSNNTERLRFAANGAWGLGGANYGTAGQVLTSNGSGSAPTWQTGGGGGGSAATPTALGTVYGNTSNSTGVTAIGYQALNVNTATNVTAFGAQAGVANTSGYIDAFGSGAGASNTTGKLAAFGYAVAFANLTGSGNAAFGGYDGSSNPTLRFNTSGSANSAFGFGALAATTTANYQTAVGYQALYSANKTANTYAYSTAVGYQAGKSTTTGDVTAIGSNVLLNNTTGTGNVGVGGETDAANAALKSNTTGSYNTAVGNYALQANVSGDSNSAFGNGALASCTGTQSTAVGYQAGYATTLSYNTFVGYQAGYSAGIIQGTAVGYQALKSATDMNTAIGYQAGTSTTSGYNNLYAGHTSGNGHTTGAYATYVGFGVVPSSATVSSELVVSSGYNGGTTAGKGASTGFINGGGGGTYQGNNSSSWSTTSDQRLKKNIADNNDGLDKINSIRVRNFEYRLPEEVDPELKPTDAISRTGVQLGVIAQELQAVLPECVKQESTGVLSVDTDNLTWYLVNAVKQLSSQVETLKAEVAALKGA